MKKFLNLFPLYLAVILSSGCGTGEQQTASAAQMPPPSVEVVTLQRKNVLLSTELPGRAVAYRKAEVRPQVTGIVQKRLFEEGAFVDAGEQLYQIDAARYESAVRTAKANLERAQSNYDAAKDRYERFDDLLKQKAVSQQNYDDAKASYRQFSAEVSVAKAALQTAEIDLGYTRVFAPISGRIGKSSVTEGALVTAQQTAVLATIHQLDPIYVDLAQPAKQLIELRQQIASGTLAQKGTAPVTLNFENGSSYQHKGSLRFSEMSVDEGTGTIAVRAQFPNPQQLLLPGMFVRAEVHQGTREDALLVPQRAVSRSRAGDAQVLVVDEKNEVQAKVVTLSNATEGSWIVEAGLSQGDRVIVAGLQKVAPGATVNPVEHSQSVTLVQ